MMMMMTATTSHVSLAEPTPPKLRTSAPETPTQPQAKKRAGNKGAPRRLRTLGGVPEAEALKRILPDYLAPNLRLVFCGINPGVWSAARGHHYAGPGNHFWPCLSASGILPASAAPVTYKDDAALLQSGVGFTNMIERTTRGQADLSVYVLVCPWGPKSASCNFVFPYSPFPR
jgi:TDG/mug DNA glycosylase family protein